MVLRRATPSRRRMLDDGRSARAMLWIMAIMLFLTTLATAFGLGAARSASAIDRDLAGRLTIQVVEADATVRNKDVAAIVDALRRDANVARVYEVDRERLAALLEPWLGDAGIDPELPMPALIDVDLRRSDDAVVARVVTAARAIVPDARVDRQAAWLAPVRGFIAGLSWIAFALVALMASATAAVVLLVARAGLDSHRGTIDILHMLGSTDVQVARLFQRRIAIDTLLGGGAGMLGGVAMTAVVQSWIDGLGTATLSGSRLMWIDWIALVLLPGLFALLAMAAARFAVLRALRRIL